MIRFKNSSGFTLIEALLSVGIMSLVITPILMVMGTLLNSVGRRSRDVDRIIQVQDFYVDSHRELAYRGETTTVEKQTTRPATHIKYEIKAMPEQSPLAKVGNLLIERATYDWKEGKVNRNDAIVSFIFKPESEKEKA